MRHAITTILLALYTTLFAVGLPLNVHYCGDTIAAIGIGQQECCCGLDTKDGCCKNEAAYIKADNNHQVASQVQTPVLHWLWVATGVVLPVEINSNHSFAGHITQSSESPPLLKAFILHNNFRL